MLYSEDGKLIEAVDTDGSQRFHPLFLVTASWPTLSAGTKTPKTGTHSLGLVSQNYAISPIL